MNNKSLTNFAYFGSKVKLMKELNEFIEDGSGGCHTFIDGFGGSGAVTINVDKYMFNKRIINDLNPRLYLIHKTLSNTKTAYKVLDLVYKTQLSQKYFFKAKKTWETYEKVIQEFENEMLKTTDAAEFENQKDMWKKYIPEEKAIELAAAALVIFKQSFNGLGKQPKPEYSGNEDLQYDKWINSTLEKVIEQMEKVEVYCMNSLVLVNKYKQNPKVFMYLDSPYELKTRGSKNNYEVDMDDEAQLKYINTIVDAKSRILISGYKYKGKSIYDKLVESGKWKCAILAEDIPKYSAGSSFGSVKPRADEWVWYNY
ncbi:DNA adenine methylase [Clostridium estertheticum]|uniref:DNA adenine methylase n=1 Tax=Clostridium estertheticum TaxID=238834 RepID=UPI001C7CC2EA|nr:DNA adenine methylase [Clostridium estertheticum]MBX4272108.1 DNA adenine methylase [Clostridium estertheticum]WLC78889.1 DNA adenine methylase [Clostridium estertheticum]